MKNDKNNQWLEDLPEAFQTYRNGRRVDEVECIIPDLAGMSRGKSMPLSKFSPDHKIFLPDTIFNQSITGNDVAVSEDHQWTEGDMVLKPDMSTAMAVPWAKEATLQVIHDLVSHDGEPIKVAPRNILKRVIKLYAERGWAPVVAPELEFYLIQPNIDPNEPVQPPKGRTGRSGSRRQSYSMSAVDDYGPVIDTIYDYAEDAGLTIDTVIQEDGAGQVEINLTHGDPLLLADQVFYFKRIIREAALNHGLFATFMAKPMRDEPGSAMHIHQSVLDIKTGKNIFSNDDGSMSEMFLHFIGGTEKYITQAMPLFAPNVNSYRRFAAQSNSSAPTNIAWGVDNRATGLRVPSSNAQNRRLENRILGVDCNPYIAIAASLALGLIGMTNKISASEPVAKEVDEGISELPHTMDEALRYFRKATEIHEILGKEFCDLYSAVKSSELEEFNREISPWEREHLLINV